MSGPESFHPASQANIYPGSTTYEKGAPQWEQFHRIRDHATHMEAIEPQIGKILFAPDSRYLKDPRETWQPTDHLPDWSDPEAAQQWVREFQQEVAAVPDEAWEVNIGAEITERVIANYPQQIVRLQGMHYTSGADIWKPSIFWVNGWTAQEENHGKVMGGLHAYSGRVNARAVDISVQSLYRNGFDPELEHDPYMGIFYTGRQERGTKTPHGRQGLIFKKVGAEKMARAQGDITGDEASHEAFYTMWGGLIFKEDPEGALIAYNRLMGKNAIMPMPGARMTHGELMDPHQKTSPEFDHFATVAHVIGAYTAADYVADSRHFEKEWNIGHLSVSGEAARAQEEILTRTEKQEKSLPRIMEWRAKRTPNQPSPWLYDRSVSMEEGAKINQAYLAKTGR